MRLAGKVAIITGAGGAIGAAIARLFVDLGASAMLTDRDGAKLDETARSGVLGPEWSAHAASSATTVVAVPIRVNVRTMCPRELSVMHRGAVHSRDATRGATGPRHSIYTGNDLQSRHRTFDRNELFHRSTKRAVSLRLGGLSLGFVQTNE